MRSSHFSDMAINNQGPWGAPGLLYLAKGNINNLDTFFSKNGK
jgi:hypothetical protein